MGVNKDKLRRDREEANLATEFKVKVGDTVLYLLPPPEGKDVFYLEGHLHYKVGKAKQEQVLCLDPNRNTILREQRLVELLTRKGVEITGSCPVCEMLVSLRQTDKERAKEQEASKKYLFPVLPILHRSSAKDDWSKLPERIMPYVSPYSIWDGIAAKFEEEGDLTDPDGALYVMLSRVGTGFKDTKYDINLFTETVRKPAVLTKALKATVRQALEHGESGDMYAKLAAMARSHAEIQAMIVGVALEEESPARDGNAPPAKKRACFGKDYADDPECRACPDAKDCEEAFKGSSSITGKSDSAPPPVTEGSEDDEIARLEKELQDKKKKKKTPGSTKGNPDDGDVPF